MIKVITSEDCGNSPKNIFVQAFSIALAKGDQKFIFSSAAEDVRWDIMGQGHIEGRDDLAAKMNQLAKEKPVEVFIHHVVTHGKAGAVNGTLKLKSGKTISFCHVYEFTNTKGEGIQQITSYEIETG
jgi:hypothetical protein